MTRCGVSLTKPTVCAAALRIDCPAAMNCARCFGVHADAGTDRSRSFQSPWPLFANSLLIDAHAVQPQGELARIDEVPVVGQPERKQRRGAHHNDRHPSADHAFGNAADNDGRLTRHGLIGQSTRRSVFLAGRILGPFADQPAGHQTDDDAEADLPMSLLHDPVRQADRRGKDLPR